MAQAIEVLKSYFEDGKKPTEEQFAELIDAFIHRDDQIPGTSTAFATQTEAEQGLNNTREMSPLLTKLAINALVRLANISELSTEVNTAIANALTTHKDQLPNAKSDSIILSDSNSLATSKAVKTLNDAKENSITKNAAFNKNFGYADGDVFEGSNVLMVGIAELDYSLPVNSGRLTVNPRYGKLTSGVISGSQPTSTSVTINHNYGSSDYMVVIPPFDRTTDFFEGILDDLSDNSFTFEIIQNNVTPTPLAKFKFLMIKA